jgi:hypothetical protein
MTRYTKSDKTNAGRFNGWFLGWDSATQGEEATEAREVQDLFRPMNATDAARFSGLQPGQVKEFDGYEYFREW